MKQKTHTIVLLASVGIYFILLILGYLIAHIFKMPGGGGFVFFIWMSIIAILVALFSIAYSLFYYYKFRHFPINNYIYLIYLILIVWSLIYIWYI